MRRSTGIKISAVECMPGLTLAVTFEDGKRVLYNPAPYLNAGQSYDLFAVAPALFDQAKPDRSRTFVCWTESIGIPGDVIYRCGRPISE